jgi:hypothetical protein
VLLVSVVLVSYVDVRLMSFLLYFNRLALLIVLVGEMKVLLFQDQRFGAKNPLRCWKF